MDEALRQKPAVTDEHKVMEKENDQLKRVVSKLVMKTELLETALEAERAARPCTAREVTCDVYPNLVLLRTEVPQRKRPIPLALPKLAQVGLVL